MMISRSGQFLPNILNFYKNMDVDVLPKTKSRRRPRPIATVQHHQRLLTPTLFTLLSTTQLITIAHATTLRGSMVASATTTESIEALMNFPTSPPPAHSPLTNQPTTLVETESLVHILHRKLGATKRTSAATTAKKLNPSSKSSSSSSSSTKKPAIDPGVVALGQTIQASMAYGQPIAHPVNSPWNPLNQDHTPQAATNQVVQLPYDTSLVPPGSGSGSSFDNAGYTAYPDVDTTLSLAEIKEKTNTEGESRSRSRSRRKIQVAPGEIDEIPSQTGDDYAAQSLDGARGQPVANPSILAGVTVVQHPSLAKISQGLGPNPFAASTPDAASFATNPLSYHPQAQVRDICCCCLLLFVVVCCCLCCCSLNDVVLTSSALCSLCSLLSLLSLPYQVFHPSAVGAAAVAQTTSPPIAYANYAGGNIPYNAKVATTIGAQRAHQFLLRSAYSPRQGEGASYPAVPWHAASMFNTEKPFTPAPLTGAWVTSTGVPFNSLVEERATTRKVRQQDGRAGGAVAAGGAAAAETRGQAKEEPDFDGNYLKRWPPPPGTSPGMISTMGMHPGVTPAVPPPAPPPIGMAPPPPPASQVIDTADVLPQPTPAVMTNDVRWGDGGSFPSQSDAGVNMVPGTEPRRSQEVPSEPLMNEPLQTSFSKENTIHGGSA